MGKKILSRYVECPHCGNTILADLSWDKQKCEFCRRLYKIKITNHKTKYHWEAVVAEFGDDKYKYIEEKGIFEKSMEGINDGIKVGDTIWILVGDGFQDYIEDVVEELEYDDDLGITWYAVEGSAEWIPQGSIFRTEKEIQNFIKLNCSKEVEDFSNMW